MALLATPHEDTPPPTAYVVCAACGPLTVAEARAAGIGQPHAGVGSAERVYQVEPQPTLAQLRRWLAQDAVAREAMEAVDALRRRSETGGAPPYRMLAARARYALLVGRDSLFRTCYRRYVQVEDYQWHPDRRHFDFWDSVLGVGWACSASVPPGAARKEIAALTRRCYAFCTLPPDAAVEAGDALASLASALRTADAQALPRSQGHRLLVQAAQALWRGEWLNAAAYLVQELGISESDSLQMEQRGTLPLMPYALLAAVLAGIRSGIVRRWFAGTRRMLARSFPASLSAQQRELGLFLDHLEYLDSLINRRAPLACPEPQGGVLAQLPLIIGYRALPAKLRRCVAVEQAVECLERQELPFLARMAAAGITAAGGKVACTQELPELPNSIRSRSEQFLDLLESTARQTERPSRLLTVQGEAAPCLHLSSYAERVELRLMHLPPHPASALRYLAEAWEAYAPHGCVELERELIPRLLPLLDSLQGLLRVEGQLAAQNTLRPAEPTVVLALAYLGEATLLAAPRLRLLPGASELAIPASGMECPLLNIQGELIAVQRHAEHEQCLVEDTLDALRRAGGLPAEARAESGVFWLAGLPAASSLLRACEELGIECLWEAGRSLSLRRAAALKLRLTRQGHDWLELGAECRVDEAEVLTLTQLLAAYEQRKGDFLPLSGGSYLHMHDKLAWQLALLELLCHGRGKHQAINRAAWPLLAAHFDEPELPAMAAVPLAPPAGLRAELRPYQQEGYAWLAARAEAGIGCFLADDMGLGKTVQTLALLLQQAGHAEASLVLAPISLLGNWAAEAARFAPGLRVHTLGSGQQLPELGAGDLLLASYGQLVARLPQFRQRTWNVLVLDEAQAIKNPASQRTRAACALRARARLCLTGTPIENSLLDLWSEMHFLNPGLLGTRSAFTRRYRRSEAAQREQLRTLLAPLVLRRRKNEVLQQLPPLTDIVLHIELSREERALYESLRRHACERAEAGPGAGFGLLPALMRLRRACCHGRLALPEFSGESSKLTAMAELVGELHAAGHRLLIYSQFTDLLDIAERRVAALGLTTLRLDGSTPARERTRRVDCFQQGGADAFLISLKAGGAGLNLTAADYVILLDPWWNPAAEMQAASRAHRMGQARPVTLCRLIVQDTIEERILTLQQDKNELAESIFEPGTTPGLDTLRALLEA